MGQHVTDSRSMGQGRTARGDRGPRGVTSRRVFLRTAAGGAAGVAAWSLLGGGPALAQTDAVGQTDAAARGPAAQTVSFDAGWLFGSFVSGSDQPGYDDSALATVTLPHTVAPLSWENWDPAAWEQTWIYRKHF